MANRAPALLTIPQVAPVLGVPERTAYRMAARGVLPVRRYGRRVFVPRAGLRRWLAGDHVEAAVDREEKDRRRA